jgi:hypothetical protein
MQIVPNKIHPDGHADTRPLLSESVVNLLLLTRRLQYESLQLSVSLLVRQRDP